MKIALLQFTPRLGDGTANLARIDAAAGQAARQGARLLLVPELAVLGYGAGAALLDKADGPDGPQRQALAALARKHGMGLVVGLSIRDEGGVFNAALFTDGARVVLHRKINLYGDYERALFRPGDGAPVTFVFGGITFGLLVCFDVEFPENTRRLARAGAQAILVPTALPRNDESRFVARHMVPTRAFENHVFVAYADLCGNDGRFGYAGLSCVVAPDGTVLASAGPWDDALLICDLDPARHVRGAGDVNYLAELAINPHP